MASCRWGPKVAKRIGIVAGWMTAGKRPGAMLREKAAARIASDFEPERPKIFLDCNNLWAKIKLPHHLHGQQLQPSRHCAYCSAYLLFFGAVLSLALYKQQPLTMKYSPSPSRRWTTGLTTLCSRSLRFHVVFGMEIPCRWGLCPLLCWVWYGVVEWGALVGWCLVLCCFVWCGLVECGVECAAAVLFELGATSILTTQMGRACLDLLDPPCIFNLAHGKTPAQPSLRFNGVFFAFWSDLMPWCSALVLKGMLWPAWQLLGVF